jgi:hypothetical protein
MLSGSVHIYFCFWDVFRLIIPSAEAASTENRKEMLYYFIEEMHITYRHLEQLF